MRSTTPFRLRVPGLEEAPADAQLTAEGGKRLGRAAVASVQRALAVPDERLGQRAQLGEAAADPVQQVGPSFENTRVPAPARE